MSVYEEPVRLSLSFEAPENTTVVLQKPVLDAYYEWQESGDDADYEYFMDLLNEQVEDHVAQWTFIRDWNLA